MNAIKIIFDAKTYFDKTDAMRKVTKEYEKDMVISNIFSSWRNTPNGLENIKEKTLDFRQGCTNRVTNYSNEYNIYRR